MFSSIKLQRLLAWFPAAKLAAISPRSLPFSLGKIKFPDVRRGFGWEIPPWRREKNRHRLYVDVRRRAVFIVIAVCVPRRSIFFWQRCFFFSRIQTLRARIFQPRSQSSDCCPVSKVFTTVRTFCLHTLCRNNQMCTDMILRDLDG